MEGDGEPPRSFMSERGDLHSGSAPRNRRILVPRFGGPELMRVVEEEIPEPGSGDVRVRIVRPVHVGRASQRHLATPRRLVPVVALTERADLRPVFLVVLERLLREQLHRSFRQFA